MNKSFKLFSSGILFFIVFLACLYFLFFDKDISSARYSGFNTIEKAFFGGIAINNTNHTIKISNYTTIIDLSPGKSSRDIGIFDIDSIVIDRKMSYKNKVYSTGFFKFCDCATVKVVPNGNIDEIKTDLTYLPCKYFDRSGWFKTINETFDIH